jgi:hypothetical protein
MPSSSLGMLTGCLISPTGGTKSEERVVQELTLKHGGKFSRNFDAKKVTHLIVLKVGSKKHEVCCISHDEYFHALHTHTNWCRFNSDGYKSENLGSFSGLVDSI